MVSGNGLQLQSPESCHYISVFGALRRRGSLRPRRSSNAFWASSGCTTQRSRSSCPLSSGRITSVLCTRPISSRIVRGLDPRPAFFCQTAECLPHRIRQEADKDVRLRALGVVVPHRTNLQIALLNPESGLRLGQLHVERPEFLCRPVRDVRAQDVRAFGDVRPLVPFAFLFPLETKTRSERFVFDQVDLKLICSSSVLAEEPTDLTLRLGSVDWLASSI